MKKTEIYVPIANKKEAEQAKAVLEAMGEKVAGNGIYDRKQNGLVVMDGSNEWAFSYMDGSWGTKITLKQLIELLVIEKREKELEENAKKLIEDIKNCSSTFDKTFIKVAEEMATQRGGRMRRYRKLLDNPKNTIRAFYGGIFVSDSGEQIKIAVRVENEKEFKALMKYYTSLGWKWRTKEEPLSVNCEEINKNYPVEIEFKDGFLWSLSGVNEGCGFTIVPFQDFAKEHGIKLPLLVSEDGVDLYKDDSVFGVTKLIGSEKWMISSSYFFKESSAKYIKLNSDRAKVFSTLEAAEKWVADKNKKTVSKVELSFVKKNGITVRWLLGELESSVVEKSLDILRRG